MRSVCWRVSGRSRMVARVEAGWQLMYRFSELVVLAWRCVTFVGTDGLRIVDVAALPRRTAGWLVGRDQAVPAGPGWLGDPLDDAALAPLAGCPALAGDADPHRRAPGTGAALAPGDARPRPPGVRDAYRCQCPKRCSESRDWAPCRWRPAGAVMGLAGGAPCGLLPSPSRPRWREELALCQRRETEGSLDSCCRKPGCWRVRADRSRRT